MIFSEEFLDYMYGNVDENNESDDDDDEYIENMAERSASQAEWMDRYLDEIESGAEEQ